MRIALVNLPSPFLLEQKAMLPLGVMYLASYLNRETRHEATIIDLADKENELESALFGLDADLVGVSATSAHYEMAVRAGAIIRKRFPGTTLVAGGVHATIRPDDFAPDVWDYVVRGEGEFAIRDIANAVANKHDIERIVARPSACEIDAFPFPAYDKIDMRSYGYKMFGGNAQTLITSRGCPFGCIFCANAVWGKKVRLHGADYIDRNVRLLMEEYGAESLQFVDDNLTLDKARLLELCRRFRDYGLKWRCYGHATTIMDPDTLPAMKKAGCVEMAIGVESGSQRILDVIDKGSTVEKNIRASRLCRDAGVDMYASLMIGLPGETPETVEETVRWVEAARPKKFILNIFTPYPGAPLSENSDKYDIRIYPHTYNEAFPLRGKSLKTSYIATASLPREEVLRLFFECYEYFVKVTGFRPGVGFEGAPAEDLDSIREFRPRFL